MSHASRVVSSVGAEANYCILPLQRYFLAEILKASSIAPTELLNLIRERGIAPSWMDMALPNGAWDLFATVATHKSLLGVLLQLARSLPVWCIKLTTSICRTHSLRLLEGL